MDASNAHDVVELRLFCAKVSLLVYPDYDLR
jgi:hypothetical protein